MQIIALGLGNPISGALAMLMFSLGTVPLMLGLGSLVSALGEKYTKLVMQTGAILIVVLGLAMLSQGVGLAGMNPVRISQGYHNTAEFDTAVIAPVSYTHLLYQQKKLITGDIGSIYLLLYGIGRFLIEFLRNDYRGAVGFLSTSQFISVFIVALGVTLMVYHRKKNPVK